MKTITGNVVRFPLASYGVKVNSYAAAVSAVGFNLIREPIARASSGKIIPGELGLFRSDNGGCVGIHSPNFSFFQPHESLETLENARRLIGGEWQSVAVLKGGRQISATIALASEVTAPRRGDKLGFSLGNIDYFDGTGKNRMPLLGNVLACDNGMVSQKAVFSMGEKHCEGTLKTRFAAMAETLVRRLKEEMAEMQGVVTQLDQTDMTSSEVVSFARALFPAPDESKVPTRTQNVRDSIATGFVRGAGNVGRTRWDAFNAVTEELDWNGTFRETQFSREENRFESIMSGSAARVRNRALELLLN